MDERLLELLSFQQSCLIVTSTVLSSPLTELLEQTEGSLISPHETDDFLKLPSLKAFPENGHPSPSILHHK
jgi:hypothetical protein